jgi:hypothetical protein
MLLKEGTLNTENEVQDDDGSVNEANGQTLVKILVVLESDSRDHVGELERASWLRHEFSHGLKLSFLSTTS